MKIQKFELSETLTPPHPPPPLPAWPRTWMRRLLRLGSCPHPADLLAEKIRQFDTGVLGDFVQRGERADEAGDEAGGAAFAVGPTLAAVPDGDLVEHELGAGHLPA